MTWIRIQPYVVRLSDRKIIAHTRNANNDVVWEEVFSNRLDTYVDVVGLNGLPLDVLTSGDLQLLSQGRFTYLLKVFVGIIAIFNAPKLLAANNSIVSLAWIVSL